MQRLIKLSLLTLSLALTACTQNGWYPFLYKPDVQQGNVYGSEMLSQLQLGMTSDQVRYIMGDPVLRNVFDTQHWNYIYYLLPGKGETKETRVTLTFVNNRLASIQK